MATVLAVAGCENAHRQPVVDARFSVLTLNVNYSKPKRAEVIEAIRRAGADVVCLQEADEDWEQALRKELAGPYPHRVFGGGFFRAGGTAVLSRFPVAKEACFRPKAGLFPVLLVRVEMPVAVVHFLNVHLRPPQWLGGPAHHRREMAEALSKCEGLAPLIVLGDFNEGDSGAAIALLKARGMSDALDLCDPTAVTWQVGGNWLSVGARLDHILAGPPLRCLSARVIPSQASDHRPVLALFQLTGRAASPSAADAPASGR
jgi:endonuclease/exonuclease/phosphatase (EEP) superfamily protein YafD